MELWRIAVRVIVAYVYLLITTRASGKRVVSQASPFELIVSLVMGDLIDDFLWSEVSAAKFGAAVVTIALCDGVGKIASFYSPRAYALLHGVPRAVLRDGHEDGRALRREQMNEADLAHLLRLQSIEKRERVHLAAIETNHEASAILQPQEEPATKEDAEKVKALLR
jgi:uncharacterized membrane protein YcaP (DUF421 family)